MSSQSSNRPTKLTIPDVKAKKEQGERLTMLTAYDYPSALLVDRAGIDIILVGDSLVMVVLGMESTVSITMEEMLHHCRAVARGSERALLVGDMPFMSYQTSVEQALHNAGRFLKEGKMDAVKLEGGEAMANTVRALTDVGIPVQGHIGLTPQTATNLGGYKVQGRSAEAAFQLVRDALALEAAGCFSIVLEAVPAPVSEIVSQRLAIPTIGIGAGGGCDGQVLVYHDLLGLFDRFTPRFVRRYAELSEIISAALETYRGDVLGASFPSEEHAYSMSSDAYEALLQRLEAENV